MERQPEDNPFLALFEPLQVQAPISPPRPKQSTPPISRDLSNEESTKILQRVNTLIEDIFSITINPYGFLGRHSNDPVKKSGLVLLESIALSMQHDQKGRSWMDVDILGQALFERLLLSRDDLTKAVLSETNNVDAACHSVETRVIIYLSESYLRCHNQQQAIKNRSSSVKEASDPEVITALEGMKALIIQNTSTSLREPELFSGQDLMEQVTQVIRSDISDIPMGITHWLENTCKDIIEEGASPITENLVNKILNGIRDDVRKVPFILLNDHHIAKIHHFVRTPTLSKLFILHNFPKTSGGGMMNQISGRSYMETLLGTIISKSCLPESELGSYDFFEQPSKQPPSVHNGTEARIWSGLEIVHEIGHEIFHSLLKMNNEVKHLTLTWIGDCFHANVGRGKMWTREMGPLLANSLASDGFFLNLSSILLRFTLPICQGVGNPKMIKIDPTYTSMDCKVSEDSFLKNVHLRNVKDETFLLPSTEEEKENDSVPDQYNFVTDIFFLAHKSLDLGFRVCHEKFVKMNQELGRLQQAYREVMSTEQGSSPQAEAIQKKMDALMTRYLTMKAALLVQSAIDNFCMPEDHFALGIQTKVQLKHG